MTLRMHLSRLTRNDKFVSEIQLSVRKNISSYTTPENTSAVTLTGNGCLYHTPKTTQYFGQHAQTYVLAVQCLQTNHSAKNSSLSHVLDKEPM
jgi:hypothetical protein